MLESESLIVVIQTKFLNIIRKYSLLCYTNSMIINQLEENILCDIFELNSASVCFTLSISSWSSSSRIVSSRFSCSKVKWFLLTQMSPMILSTHSTYSYFLSYRDHGCHFETILSGKSIMMKVSSFFTPSKSNKSPSLAKTRS